MELIVFYSMGGHDALWFKYEPDTKLSLPELFKDAQKRWLPKYGKLKALYILKQNNPKFVAPGDEFCGFDNRGEWSTLDYFKKSGLTWISA